MHHSIPAVEDESVLISGLRSVAEVFGAQKLLDRFGVPGTEKQQVWLWLALRPETPGLISFHFKMDNKKRLAYAIIRFLHDQLRHGGLSSDAQESLEVAIQCLETAFGVTVEDSDLALPQTLPEIFEAAVASRELPQDLRSPQRSPPSEEDSAEAERLKTEGNEQMKAENFEAAVHFYGKAIELNPANAVYFCNRAAAYSKLGNYAGAVQDCERAICIDPLALSSLNKHTEAVAYYRKALELDPDNETYKSNLKVAELRLREAPSPTGGVGGFDIAGLLNNPSFMSMASNLMNNPQVQQLMSGMISGGHNPLGSPGTSPSQNDLASLIQAGQQFAQQMQQQNPELIEQLRSQIRSRTPSASNDDQQE
ncbi:Small glutamine-rich tetratricopeptide repeat-containing protein alpha [Camelus dromedarius]|uniref:Small glutamine-rich tetratricopeptide repeat-containing protein alpha n=1 Tax=Camelus dromedarius TaxID=9838 RepID=A0A5N4CJQ5_CAMDR|nr:Small glutamine-rich tetratricopeptide repeat-containing protein alpha [Camelus dromedarius]